MPNAGPLAERANYARTVPNARSRTCRCSVYSLSERNGQVATWTESTPGCADGMFARSAIGLRRNRQDSLISISPVAASLVERADAAKERWAGNVRHQIRGTTRNPQDGAIISAEKLTHMLALSTLAAW